MSPNQIKTRKVSLARLEGNQISSLWILFFPPSLPPDQSCNPWRAGGVHLEAHSTSAHHERAQGSILPLPAPRSLFFVLPPSDQVPSGQNPSEGQHSCSEEAPRMNRALAQAQCPLFSLLGFCSPLSTSQKPFYSPGYLQRARDFIQPLPLGPRGSRLFPSLEVNQRSSITVLFRSPNHRRDNSTYSMNFFFLTSKI